jgi:hypothetical protein
MRNGVGTDLALALLSAQAEWDGGELEGWRMKASVLDPAR